MATLPTDRPVTPLRQRMLDDMAMRAMRSRAQHYVRHVRAFVRYLARVRKKRCVVYAKPPFAGPETGLAYVSRYPNRLAISNSRFPHFDEMASPLGGRNTTAPTPTGGRS